MKDNAISRVIDANAKDLYAAFLRIGSLPGLVDHAQQLFDYMPENEWDSAGGYAVFYNHLCAFLNHVHTIDLDERGEYRCHVDNCNGETVWSASTDENGEFWPTVDGFMKHTSDMTGLASYLADMKVIPHGSTITNEG